MGTERDTPVWVRGSSEEDTKRYKELMDYMEEKRVEARELLREENERKERAKEKENSWALLRLSMAYLKEHEEGWRVRKLKECDRIREEEKMDRLAVVREKKRKYGLKRISKEENKRLKRRTEERLEIASAKANLWRRFRDRNKELDMTEEEAEAWEGLRASVMELEEGGSWRETGEEAAQLHQLVIRVRKERLVPGGQVQREEGGHGGAEERMAGGVGDQQDSHGQGGVCVHGDGYDGGGGRRE